MPQINVTREPKSEVKITFVVTQEEAKPYLEEAARELTVSRPLPGFRPGKASYDDVKRVHGEMRILEAALERLVRALYVKTILAQNIDTIGSPAINVDQLTPGQDIKFTVIAPVEPTVTTMPDLSACHISKKDLIVQPEEVDKALTEMRTMRRQEAVVERAATLDDLVVIDLEMQKDHVAIEGGTGLGFRVLLSEDHYIPGLTKELVGMKAGDERTFVLKFPTEHYQKHLSGQDIEFHAKATEVRELQLPELNDEFAKAAGLESLVQLREKLTENMKLELQEKQRQAMEIELLEKLVDASSFSEMPELLINQEVARMTEELHEGVEEQGMKWDEYLSSIKKTSDDLKLDFIPQALRRIRAAILIKAFTKQQNITLDEKETDTEIDRILEQIKPEDHETRERVISPEYREYVSIRLRNRKTLDWLKTQCTA